MKKRASKFIFIYVLTAILVSVLLAGCSLNLAQQAEVSEPVSTLDDQLKPHPGLSPREVIKIQVEALQNNDDQDRGIEITFRFASPANKQVTGPLGRFKRLLKNPLYSPLLNHKSVEYSPLEISGDAATQRVTIIDANGKATLYLFKLSKQSGPPCPGCWMTDSVILVPISKQNLQGA